MKISLEPGASVRLALTTALASSREEALALIDTHSTTDSVARTFELAWADARVELKHLGVSAVQSHRFQRLLSAVLFPDPSLRASSEKVPIGRGPSTLWTHGISGDLPIVMVCIDDPEFSDLLHEVLLAQEFWRLNGIDVDLVVLNEEPSGYLQPQQEVVRGPRSASCVTGLSLSTTASHERGAQAARGLRAHDEASRSSGRTSATPRAALRQWDRRFRQGWKRVRDAIGAGRCYSCAMVQRHRKRDVRDRNLGEWRLL